MKTPLVEVKNLKMYFPILKGFLNRTVGHVKAVDDVSLTIFRGETLGLVGESGCGKTTLGRCIVRAYAPTGGEIVYHGDSGGAQPGGIDLTQLDEDELRACRREIRMIFQDPYSSLNPRMTVFDSIADPMRIHNLAHGKALEDRVSELLARVGLRTEFMRRYPHAFSGGQRQRIGIARALALQPRLVIADEPVSALDVSIRAQILVLMLELQRDFDLTYLFISHDLSVVEYIADRVAVMYVGALVELAATDELYTHPKHPYTEALLSSIPKPDPLQRSKRIVLPGDVADPARIPEGCRFHPRCRYAQARCRTEPPILRDIGRSGTGGRHLVACHYADELELIGIESVSHES